MAPLQVYHPVRSSLSLARRDGCGAASRGQAVSGEEEALWAGEEQTGPQRLHSCTEFYLLLASKRCNAAGAAAGSGAAYSSCEDGSNCANELRCGDTYTGYVSCAAGAEASSCTVRSAQRALGADALRDVEEKGRVWDLTGSDKLLSVSSTSQMILKNSWRKGHSTCWPSR